MKKKILFIENDEQDLKFWSKKLEDNGYEIIISQMGEKALNILKNDWAGEKTISLVILSIMLPDIDGISILREIKESKPVFPVIMHTAYDFRDDFAVWMSEAYIIKNQSNPDELISAVKNLS